MQITFNQSGSSQGRKDFANGVTDFGDSDIPYQGVDPTTGQTDASTRPYAYAPVVAGGTAFTYHLTAGGHLVTNLRLSGETITKIFTNKITNWADPADHQGERRPRAAVGDDQAGRPLGRLGCDRSVHAVDGQAVPVALAAVQRRQGRPDLDLPASGQPDRGRPGRRRHEHHQGLRR